MKKVDYPFPYEESTIQSAFERYTASLLHAINGNGPFKKHLKQYKNHRKLFQRLLSPKDYRYFSFQLWQEGLARYTKYKYLEALESKTYQANETINHLPDIVDYNKYKQHLYKSELQKLTRMQLKDSHRVCFYATGFAEGLLLDRLNPSWRNQFKIRRFFLEKSSEVLRVIALKIKNFQATLSA